MPLYDYECECGRQFSAYQRMSVRKTAKCECGKTGSLVITRAPMFKLDPISGDFPTSTDKWAKQHEQANYDDLQELGLRESRKTITGV